MKLTGYQKPQGTFYRKYQLSILEGNTAQGWIEDDFHHFGLMIDFSNDQICSITPHTVRYPWTTCAGAGDAIQSLVGKPLVSRASDIGKLVDMRQQCTHIFDLAGLILAHISKRHERNSERQYIVSVPDRNLTQSHYTQSSFGPGEARLFKDGQEVMYWKIDGSLITGPDHYSGINHDGRGFRQWTETLPEDEAEYVTILRRAVFVSSGRAFNADDYPSAAAMHNSALCHSFQPERSRIAFRNYGSEKNFSASPEALLRWIPTC